MYRKLEEARPLIAPACFYELRYEQLTADPAAAVGAIYEYFQWPGFPSVLPAVLKYAERAKRFKTNRHELSPELRREIARRWAAYLDKYGYSE
jgi:hypothetical protein